MPAGYYLKYCACFHNQFAISVIGNLCCYVYIEVLSSQIFLIN